MESEDENVTAIRGSVMVYCTECGFANEQGNAFCSQCGSPLEQPEANPAAPAYDDNALTLVKQPAAPLPAVAPPTAPGSAVPGSMAPGPMTAGPAAPASPEPPAGRPGGDHTKAVVIVLIALICVVALVIGLFVTHSMGLWGAQPQAQTSVQSTGSDASDSADDGTTDSSDAKSKAKKNTSDSAKDKNSDDSSKKSSTEKSKPSTPVITSSQLSDIADSYSSSDVAVSAMVIDGTYADSSEDATIATTSQSGKQFVAAGLYLPVYLAAQDNGDDNAKAQANAMMGSMDNNAGNMAAAAVGGWSGVNSWASSHGYKGTSFNRDFGDVAASNAGYENYSSSRDAARMLAAVDAKGGASLMNVDIASEGVTIPSDMIVHAHRGQGIQDTWNYFAIVEANGHKAAVAVVTQYQGQSVAADLMSRVLASVDKTLGQ